MNIFDRLRQGIRTHSPEETMAVAAELAKALPPDTTLALHGDLGAGKSTFVRGLGQAWGITDPITSPTYNIFSIYQGTRQLIHMDAYRLESAAQAESLLIDEFMRTPWCLAVEWPEKVEGWLAADAMRLYFACGKEGHTIRLTS